VCCGAAFAEGSSTEEKLMQIISQQNEKIDALLKRVEELERKQETDTAQSATAAAKNEELAAKVESIESSMKKFDSLDLKPVEWAKNISFSGDFRYRFQFTDEKENDNRNEHRVRVRIGLKSNISDDLDATIRIATGSSADGTSTMQTLDGAFNKKNIWLDLAYLDWHPSEVPGLNLMAGKMANPFFLAGGNDLLLDSDINPEGIAAKYLMQCDPVELFANLGGFWLDERFSNTETNADSALWGAQGGVKYSVNSDVKLIGGLSIYDFTNLKDEPVLGSAKGNTVYKIGTTSYYPEDFTIIECFAELDFKVADLPAALFGNYLKNTQFDSNNDAFLVGFSLGKCKDPGSWEFAYNYRRIESDAIIGALADGDFCGGSTDGEGHKFAVGYQLTKPIRLNAAYFYDDKNFGDERAFHRGQFDINYKL